MRYYYVSTEGATTGPVALDTLRTLRTGGSITDQTPVIVEGAQTWQTYAAHSATAPAPAPSGARAPEDVVRERITTAGAYATATAKVLGEVASVAARRTADSLGDLSKSAGTSATVSTPGTLASTTTIPTLRRAHAAWFFAGALVLMVLVPIGSVSVKGRAMPITVLNSLRNQGDWNGAGLLALLMPIIGIVLALKLKDQSWRRGVGVASLGMAFLTYLSLGTTERFARAATMGIAETHAGIGMWLLMLGCIAVAVLALAGRPATSTETRP